MSEDSTGPSPGTTPDFGWKSASAHWAAAIASLPERPTVSKGPFSRSPKGYGPEELPGKSVVDMASAFGRPAWWTPEPATGGAILAWPALGAVAVHVDTEGICDRVLRKGTNELDLSWRMRSLCNVIGLPLDHVVRQLGQPTSRSGGANYTLVQWATPGYHIALKFDASGRCQGITHQHIRNPVAL